MLTNFAIKAGSSLEETTLNVPSAQATATANAIVAARGFAHIEYSTDNGGS